MGAGFLTGMVSTEGLAKSFVWLEFHFRICSDVDVHTSKSHFHSSGSDVTHLLVRGLAHHTFTRPPLRRSHSLSLFFQTSESVIYGIVCFVEMFELDDIYGAPWRLSKSHFSKQ